MTSFFYKYIYIIVPAIIWTGIQLFKLIYDRIETKKWHFKRFLGSGGMPSSHSAVSMSLATLIGKHIGIESPLFALSMLFAFITMYDACGVRREVGNQAKVLNDIISKQNNMSYAQKLQELTGHTPFQVIMGALIGFLIGLIF